MSDRLTAEQIGELERSIHRGNTEWHVAQRGQAMSGAYPAMDGHRVLMFATHLDGNGGGIMLHLGDDRVRCIATCEMVELGQALVTLWQNAPALIAAAKREAEPRCPDCNGELCACGEMTADGPSMDCRACQLRSALDDAVTQREMWCARTTSAEQRAVAAERRVKELEKALKQVSGKLAALSVATNAARAIARTALAQPPESKETRG